MSEDLSDYIIDPNDLGCGPEEENPAGLVEESGMAAPKVPVPKSFEHIPFEIKKRARKLYDSFTKKDMSFESFCIELYALESPKLMQADLQKITEEKHSRNQQLAANLHSINKGNLN